VFLRLTIKPDVVSRAVRGVVAALLVFATLASATRADALFAVNSSGMDCCKAMGGAMKDSCPFMRLKGQRRQELIQPEAISTDKNASSSAELSKPCPADCCCQTGSLTRTPRPRDEAAVSNKLRPRPPTSAVRPSVALAALVISREPRRLSPPRAPPASL
jgi:hypothetical protein